MLLLGVGVAVGQAPPGPKDGLVFTTDDNGKSYPYTFALTPPPWAIKGKGAVDRVKYPGGTITSTELKVTITSTAVDENGKPAWTVETTATVSADKLTFEIVSPSGGLPSNRARVVVTGKFKPTATDPERDVTLSGVTNVQ